MELKALNEEIISDESEAGRKRSLEKLYRELEKAKGYRRSTLGKTKYGPVYFFEEAERKEGKKDVLLLGGLHPFCEAATTVSVVHAMRERHNYNLHAVPLVSPWAFVAPVRNRRHLKQYDGDEASKIKQYRDVNYHDTVNLEEVGNITLYGSARDMERLTKISGHGFDLAAECHMDYERGNTSLHATYAPTYRVGFVLSMVSPKDFTAAIEEAMWLRTHMDTATEVGKGRNDFLLNEGSITAVLETDPDDITLLKRFVDVLVRHL
jgi:hypothetical protein